MNRQQKKAGRSLRLCVVALLVIAVSVGPAWPELASNVLTPYREKVDVAVDKGLAYLAGVQAKEGFFNGQHGKTSGVVALCGMAFLAKGHTPGFGPHGDVINRAIDYVLAHQNPAGMFAAPGSNMYSHNIATLFVLEVSGMVDPARQKRLDKAISKAIKLILTAQQVNKAPVHKGGWRYAAGSGDSDMSCTGWALMALRSARLNGAPVPDAAIKAAVDYVVGKQNPDQGGFGYQNQASLVTLSGAGLLCLELTGHHGDPKTLKAGEYLLKTYSGLPAQSQFIYGLYYASQGMFQLGGKYWDKFAPWMYDFLLPKQSEDGSWLGVGNTWGSKVNPSYFTAMTILAFTVPYRQLPIYQRDETVDEAE